MNKKRENKGSFISSVGGLFTIIGMTLLTIQSSAIWYLSFTVLGVIITAYGVFVMFKAGRIDNNKK